MNLIDRIKNILLSPKSELQQVRAEASSIQQLYSQYLIIVAALPAVGTLLLYWRTGFGSFGMSLRAAVSSYLVILASAYISARIVDYLASNFSSTKDMTDSLKLVAYSFTPSLLAGLFAFVPGLRGLIVLAGMLYSIYLLYLGLPILKDTPSDRVVPYMIAIFVVSIIVFFVINGILGTLLGVGWMMR